MTTLESKYMLFDSIEQLLTPETLSEVLSASIIRVDHTTPTVWGNSGSKFSIVDTNSERLLLKRMSIKFDWEMFATNDHLCRSVTLWQYGLLDQALPYLAHEIIACAKEGDVWAILMKDISGHFLWETPEKRTELTPTFLDAMARLHAEFWNDPRLQDPTLGLDGPGILYQLASPDFAQKHKSDHWGWLPDGAISGWEVMEDRLDADVMSYMKKLIEDPKPLLDALSQYPHTLLHGDLYDRNLAYKETNQAVAVDWQLAMCSLMTIDLARFILEIRDERVEHGQAQEYYRRRLEEYLSEIFSDEEWQAMIDLGILNEALWITCFLAFGLANTENQDFRHYAEMRLEACNQQVRDGIRWL